MKFALGKHVTLGGTYFWGGGGVACQIHVIYLSLALLLCVECD